MLPRALLCRFDPLHAVSRAGLHHPLHELFGDRRRGGVGVVRRSERVLEERHLPQSLSMIDHLQQTGMLAGQFQDLFAGLDRWREQAVGAKIKVRVGNPEFW